MMYQSYVPAPDGTATYEVLTENGHHQLRNLTPDIWRAIQRDVAEARSSDESVDTVLAVSVQKMTD
jgi:hypothetical protein